MTIKGLTVEKVLVTEAVDIASEYYLGVTHDRDRRKVVLIASAAGGVDIEQVAEETPEKIVKIWADPLRRLADGLASTSSPRPRSSTRSSSWPRLV